MRKYGELGSPEAKKKGMMKFVYADIHDDDYKKEMKIKNKISLENQYEHLKRDKLVTELNYENYVGEQSQLWKTEV